MSTKTWEVQKAKLYTRSEPMLLPYFPRLFYQALREREFEDEQIFDGLSLGVEQLFDETYRLSIEQHEAFILRMLELTNNPHLALDLIKIGSDSAPNLPLLAAANSGQIGKALRIVTRYSKVLTRVYSITLYEMEEPPKINIDLHVEHEQVAYFAVSSFALFLSQFFREALDGAELVQRLDLSVTSPDSFELVRDHFPFEVRFSQPASCVVIDGTQLDHPMREADPHTLRMLTDMAEQQLREAEAETSLQGAVTQLLIEQLVSPPRLTEAAHILGLSPRGLRRKLADSGTTYQRILDSVRLAMAKRLLSESDTPIASIAYELGYSNPSDFGRAFKHWCGRPPTQYRKQH